MNPWLNDSSAALNNHAGFRPQGDGTMAFLQHPTSINPAQFQNQPYLNGAGRTASPGFHNPMYQTNPVVPSKRSREDSLGGSPRQTPSIPPGSRSQTPGQPQFSGFNPQQTNGGPSYGNAPTAFQHLQTSNTASPSPTIQQNNFNPQGNPVRVSTASPSPFSPHHGGNPQMSPGPPDQNSRVGTPHDNQQQQNFMPPTAFANNFNGQQFGANMVNPGQMGMNPMNMAQQQMHQQGMNAAQRNYQIQMQAQARQLHAAAQQRSANGMTGHPQGMQPHMGAPEQQNAPIPRPSPEDFMRGLQQFMAQRGRTIDPNPVICGRQVQLPRIYIVVAKSGGSARLSKLNQWPAVAQQLSFPPQQSVQAGQELQHYWMATLGPYESALLNAQQRQRMAQGQMQNAMPPVAQAQGQDQTPAVLQKTQPELTNMKINGQQPNQVHPSTTNGTPPARDRNEQTPSHRPSLSRQLDPQHLNGAPIASPSKRPSSASIKAEPETDATMPVRKPIENPFKPDVISPSRYHGPIIVDEMFAVGEKILELKPIQPTLRELGVIDIHALTMAIKSGMHAETRVALDTLIALSTESSLQLSLQDCEDLMETLIDYAQTQLDLLAENAAEVTDDMSLASYEEVLRACRAETESLQEVPEFGTFAYDLDRAADRLICITTLIRNFSFYEANFVVLGQPEAVQLVTNVIQCLGTKEMPLRTHRNTLDFMKDIVIYLSNLSTSLNLPGKQEALCLLHFLLAFAPTPSPVSATSEKVSFAMYNPSLHKYMPSAVDSLAKLLARDEPNRMYYKSIFHADANSPVAYELLTQTFGLAIAPIPSLSSNTRAVVEARKPFLLQGMLAAEILATLAPSSDHTLARAWLESDDNFAGSLIRLVTLLSSQAVAAARPPPPQPGRGMPPHLEPDANAYAALTNRSMAVLKILVQKSKVVDEQGNVSLPTNVALKRETLLGAMIQKDIDPFILRQLCSYAALEE